MCVIPVGCVEAHGIHLPLGCDTIKGQEFALRASEKEPVCVFPGMWFGEKTVENTCEAFKFIREETISVEYHKEWLAKQK